jgi:aerobic-type carbon monoxide dehydrogenase small subunit (CoxS/CutS family)
MVDRSWERTVNLVSTAFEREVSFEIDGRRFSFATWSDVSALFAIRFLARCDRPRRGCESGLCGTCESLVDGEPKRLCLMPSTSLDGVSIVSGSMPGR